MTTGWCRQNRCYINRAFYRGRYSLHLPTPIIYSTFFFTYYKGTHTTGYIIMPGMGRWHQPCVGILVRECVVGTGDGRSHRAAAADGIYNNIFIFTATRDPLFLHRGPSPKISIITVAIYPAAGAGFYYPPPQCLLLSSIILDCHLPLTYL